eukprot:m.211142 g.211142  ORF g.211142 m.211142 type:complete len:318 (+) comp10138_c5_seq20:373-1326(+)
MLVVSVTAHSHRSLTCNDLGDVGGQALDQWSSTINELRRWVTVSRQSSESSTGMAATASSRRTAHISSLAGACLHAASMATSIVSGTVLARPRRMWFTLAKSTLEAIASVVKACRRANAPVAEIPHLNRKSIHIPALPGSHSAIMHAPASPIALPLRLRTSSEVHRAPASIVCSPAAVMPQSLTVRSVTGGSVASQAPSMPAPSSPMGLLSRTRTVTREGDALMPASSASRPAVRIPHPHQSSLHWKLIERTYRDFVIAVPIAITSPSQASTYVRYPSLSLAVSTATHVHGTRTGCSSEWGRLPPGVRTSLPAKQPS